MRIKNVSQGTVCLLDGACTVRAPITPVSTPCIYFTFVILLDGMRNKKFKMKITIISKSFTYAVTEYTTSNRSH